jgi:hypothetical protein
MYAVCIGITMYETDLFFVNKITIFFLCETWSEAVVNIPFLLNPFSQGMPHEIQTQGCLGYKLGC